MGIAQTSSKDFKVDETASGQFRLTDTRTGVSNTATPYGAKTYTSIAL
jgi:hypothetical protein